MNKKYEKLFETVTLPNGVELKIVCIGAINIFHLMMMVQFLTWKYRILKSALKMLV